MNKKSTIDTMTPSEKAKGLGFKSLIELSRLSGESVQTLINWHKNHPSRFEFLAVGVANSFVHTKAKYNCKNGIIKVSDEMMYAVRAALRQKVEPYNASPSLEDSIYIALDAAIRFQITNERKNLAPEGDNR